MVLVGSVTITNASTFKQLDIDPHLQNFKFSKVKSIPKGPNPKVEGSNCEFFVNKEPNHLKNYIENLGWRALSEVKLANYRLVAFAGNLEAGTSGSCLISQSNIAIFSGKVLLGLIYLDSSDATLIGDLKLTDAGYVKILSGNYIQQPIAEIHLNNNGLELTRPSAFTAYCNGNTIVPNTIGTKISSARETLFSYGFEKGIDPNRYIPSWRNNLLQAGISEVSSCSGTGFAFCRFIYINKNSVVSLITAGEADIPVVVRDVVECEDDKGD